MISRNELGAAARRGVRWTALGAAGTVGLQLLQIAVLARLLDPADFGRMAMVLVILTIGSTFSELGLSSAIIQRGEIRREELGTLYVLNLIAGGLLALLLWLSAPLISSVLGVGDMTGLIRGAALVFVISPWTAQFRALLQKRLEFDRLAVVNLSAVSVGTVATLAFASAGFGVWALLGGYLVTKTVTSAILAVIALRQGLWSGFSWNPTGVRSYLSFGSFRLAAMFANNINSRMDQLVIGTLMGAASLGLYNVAQRLVLEPVQRINPIVTQVAFPIFSLARDEPERLRRGYLRMTGLLLGINAPLLLGLAATAHLVVPVVLGQEWNSAIGLIQVLAIYALFRSIANAGGALIMAKGRADWSFFWNAAKLLIVPLTIWLAARWTGSVAGVAYALAILQLFLLVAHYFLLLRRLIGKCGIAYLMSITRPVVAAVLTAVFVLQCDRWMHTWPAVSRLAIVLIVGAAAYFALSFLVQRDLLQEIAGLVRGRNGVLRRASAD